MTRYIDQRQNQDEIVKLDAEIAFLEKQLGLKGNQKAKRKLNKQLDSEGMGLGFLDFLDEIDINLKQGKKFTKKDYDFLDDDKEVLLDENDLVAPDGSD